MSTTSRWLRFWAYFNGALVVALVGSAIFGSEGVVHHEKLAEDLGHTRELNQDLERQNAVLAREVRAFAEDDHVEHVIRNELGWVRSDEVIVLFPSAAPTPPAPAVAPPAP
jgi:cell division protein FtsB